jgi:hypothetical protein
MTFDANAKGLRLLAGAPPRLRFHFSSRVLFSLLLFASSLFAQSKSMYITKHYLNIPVARAGEMHVYQIQVDGIQKREFPVQLAEHSPDYWIFIDVSEFKGQTITLLGPSSQAALDGIYQADKIEGADSLYKERNRPQFHFTVKRGWIPSVLASFSVRRHLGHRFHVLGTCRKQGSDPLAGDGSRAHARPARLTMVWHQSC